MFKNLRLFRLLIICKILIYVSTNLVNGKKIADIYWNTTNPIFYFDNKFHIFNVRLMDHIDIICPQYDRGFPEDEIQHSKLFLVDRKSYETCDMSKGSMKLAGVCTHPYSHQLITIVFREFTPSPSMLQFQANKTYYIISTSSGSKHGVNNDIGGLCKIYNMRLQLVVRPRCRPKYSGSILGQSSEDDSEEFDDCDDNSVNSRMPIAENVPSWTVDVRPPPFPWPKHEQPYPGGGVPGPRVSGSSSLSSTGFWHFAPFVLVLLVIRIAFH